MKSSTLSSAACPLSPFSTTAPLLASPSLPLSYVSPQLRVQKQITAEQAAKTAALEAALAANKAKAVHDTQLLERQLQQRVTLQSGAMEGRLAAQVGVQMSWISVPCVSDLGLLERLAAQVGHGRAVCRGGVRATAPHVVRSHAQGGFTGSADGSFLGAGGSASRPPYIPSSPPGNQCSHPQPTPTPSATSHTHVAISTPRSGLARLRRAPARAWRRGSRSWRRSLKVRQREGARKT